MNETTRQLLPGLADTSGSEGCAWTNLRAYWAECEKLDKDYRTPDERLLLGEMFTPYKALKRLGWQDIIYCPKDGTEFLSISAGSTGVHRCRYDGEWPKGAWWVLEAGDMWPSHPILWRPMPPNTDLPTATGTGCQPEQAFSCAAREGNGKSRPPHNETAAPTGETGRIDAPAGPLGPVGIESPNAEQSRGETQP